MIKLSKWEKKTGIDFLRKIGIKEDYKVLDFGCNNGNYTIPISILIGKTGTVFAIDENISALSELQKKSKLIQTNNIEIINTKGDLKLDFSNNFIDFVMLYDILHYLDYQQRKILYKEIFRILKDNSILSVHAKHTIGNFALMELRNVTKEELINEIENAGFEFQQEICSELTHDGHLENGCIINFIKR
ncbi:MAG: class I SAM-dependent methyltransferase [Candidatus Cloacimonadota bacterium]|nr:class I SAM-dependent methyltransferase [Candidatus Cloacimonadota bacterium]